MVASEQTTHRSILIWLYCCCAMILVMAVIGAITRLTESGLSMTEWRPVTGWLPPLTEEEWQRQYELYRQSPEFRYKHNWMDLADFKKIFFWEWLHRLWGRLTGLVYALPLVWFWIKGRIPPGTRAFFLGLLALGAFQGFVGWWMVKSGLIDRPSVSHFRLAAHLGLALLLFGLLWAAALRLRDKPIAPALDKTAARPRIAWACLGLLALTIVWGAFVAGTDAGLIYNSFPAMDGRWLPHSAFDLSALAAEPGWIQFTHRWLALLTALAIMGLAWRIKDFLLFGMVILQAGLGIATLLSHVWIPLAALHQAGAVILLALMIRAGLALQNNVTENNMTEEQGTEVSPNLRS